jgi:hypothetical protein
MRVRNFILGTAAAGALTAVAVPAHADWDRWHRWHEHHYWHHPHYGYYGYYVAPPPVYYAPPPVYYAPPPVYYAPGIAFGFNIR